MLIIFLIINGLSFWGFHAHKIINKHAVYTLPKEMSDFFKLHIEYLEESSVNPDIRKYADKREAKKHYIDLEYYQELGSMDSILSVSLDSINRLIPEDSLKEWGILPWSIHQCYLSLKKAFQDNNSDLILRYASDLGHYIADAHVPLHTTKNYNGQLSGQDGIHALWESQIPEKYSEGYLLFTGRAEYIENVKGRIIEVILQSYEKSKIVLARDRSIRSEFSQSETHQMGQKGDYLLKRYSEEYVKKFNAIEGDNIENQMRSAIKTLGDFWLTAWIDAGQPDLKKLRSEQKKAENKLRKKTKIIELKEEREHN